MLHALVILVDDDFHSPIYAEPDPDDLEPEVWQTMRQLALDGMEGEVRNEGTREVGEGLLAWRFLPRNGLSFFAFVEDIDASDVKAYLKDLVRQYFDEVDDVRKPERDGVADVVVDVIPPWEE